MRKDGRFHGTDGSIPEGQGIINANLNECHELVEMVSHVCLHHPLFPFRYKTLGLFLLLPHISCFILVQYR